jgi:hypothetical protein
VRADVAHRDAKREDTTGDCERERGRLLSTYSDTLDVVAQHLTMTLGTTLAKALASLATSGHFRY